MVKDLRLTEIQWGWIMAAFPLGYALFQFPGGYWGDRKGPRLTLAVITIAWGVLIAVTSLTPARDGSALLVIGFLLDHPVRGGRMPTRPCFPSSLRRSNDGSHRVAGRFPTA
jgi:MFS family permease